MKRLHITHPHCKPEPEVRALVEQLAVSLQQRYQLTSKWQNASCIHFERKGINGTLRFSASEVVVSIELGLLMSALARTIERELEHSLQKHLG